MSDQMQDIESGLPEHHIQTSCCSSLQLWWHCQLSTLESFLHAHHWKMFGVVLVLLLLCLGLKFAKTETDYYRLWVGESGRLSAELNYLARALRAGDARNRLPLYSGGGGSSIWGDPYYRRSSDLHSSGPIDSDSYSSPLGGLPGSEFMGSVESILQVSSSHNGDLLTPEALRDHMDLLLKIHSIEVKVGASKWRLEDLCQRPELPPVAGVHSIEMILAKLIPCVVITPLDCFWEGSKVLAPDADFQIPWLNTLYTLQWPTVNPQQLISSLRAEGGNHSADLNYLDDISDMLERAGLSHGYLNRPCLDPLDRSCPKLTPNFKSSPPDIAGVLSNGCPSFAANVLHWPRDLIVGGQRCFPGNRSCGGSKERLVGASALQSLLLLRSPQDFYQTVRFDYPYESWTLLDAQNALDQWRNELKHYLRVHNKATRAANRDWQYYGFTDNSLRDLLTQSTVRVWFAQLAGATVLVLLYGMVCLLCWREPSRSQCWLAIVGLGLIVLALIAGLGVCALIGLPLNVLSVQVLPFMLLGLGMEGLFVFTTCNTCVLSRSSEATNQRTAEPCTTHVLTEHGTALIFSALAMLAAFFAAAYLPAPVMRQFCLQAGILTLVQAVTIFTLFPVLLKLDAQRRARHRMDVLCCLRQPVSVEPHGTLVTLATGTGVSTSDTGDGVVHLVETASTKVRLSDNAVATVKISVSTHNHPSATAHALGLHTNDCFCVSCRGNSHQALSSAPLFVCFASRLASMLSRFLAVRIIVCLFGLILLISATVLTPMRLKLGLNIQDLIPKDALEHGYVEKSSNTFGLIHFQLVARGSDADLREVLGKHHPEVTSRDSALFGPGVDFARSQEHLRRLFQDIVSLPGVSFTGGRLWLDAMYDWLLDLQNAFDADVERGAISLEGNWSARASEQGLLGLLMMVQTDNGVDLNRIKTGRLVRRRTIDPTAFRVYLHAWRVLDVFNYTAPPDSITPDPGPHLERITLPPRAGGREHLYSIAPAPPIQMVQTTLFARGYATVAEQIEFVRKVRALTEQSISQGVPVFPTGLAFTLAEHYLAFWQDLSVAAGILTGAVLAAGIVFLPHPMAALLAVCVGGGGAVAACLLGLLLLGLDVNTVSGALLLLAFGLGTKFSSGVLCGWYGPQHNIHRSGCGAGAPKPTKEEKELQQPSQSEREKKLFAVLQNQICAVVHANVSSVLAVALLVAVRVEFIADHFFHLMGIISMACIFDSVILLPTVCFLLEPLIPSPTYSISALPSPPPPPLAASPLRFHHDMEATASSSSRHFTNTNPKPEGSSCDSGDNELETENEEDLAMRRLCETLKMSTRSPASQSKHHLMSSRHTDPRVSAVINFYANELREASRHGSLSTISEEPSNSNSTISLHSATFVGNSSAQPPLPPQPSTSSAFYHPSAVTAMRMKEFLPLFDVAMAVSQQQQHHHQRPRQQIPRSAEPPPPPYSERPSPASR